MFKNFPWIKGSSDRKSAERDAVPERIVLYSNKRSSCSWRVRIALNLKQIPYEIETVGLEKGSVDQFLDVNPMVHVPALRIDNHTLIGSLNILQYLEETRARHPLLPVEPVQRARVREICDVIASGIQPLQYWVVLSYIGEERKREWAQHWITRGLKAVETLLRRYAGLFCVGDDLSLADCCLVPQLYNARMYGVDLKWYPVTLRVEGNLKNQPAFTHAHPNNHPDSPSKAITLL